MKTLQIFVLTFILLLCANLLAEEETKTRINIRVNGHDHLIKDQLFDTLTANWQENVDSLERKIKKEFSGDGGPATTVHVSNKINGLKIKYDDVSEELYMVLPVFGCIT